MNGEKKGKMMRRTAVLLALAIIITVFSLDPQAVFARSSGNTRLYAEPDRVNAAVMGTSSSVSVYAVPRAVPVIIPEPEDIPTPTPTPAIPASPTPTPTPTPTIPASPTPTATPTPTVPASPTPTPTVPPIVIVPPTAVPNNPALKVNMIGRVDAGTVDPKSLYTTQDITSTSQDGHVTLYVPDDMAGYTPDPVTGDNVWVDTITVKPALFVPDLPENTATIGYVMDFGPDGARFAPALLMSFTYIRENLPEKVTEDELFIAYWDNNASEWQRLESFVDKDNQVVTAYVSHFTDYALITPNPPKKPIITVSPSPTTTAKPIPTDVSPTVDPTQPIPVQPTVTPTILPDAFDIRKPFLVGFILAMLLVLVMLWLLLARRRQGKLVFVNDAYSMRRGGTSGEIIVEVRSKSDKPFTVDDDYVINLTTSSSSGRFDTDASGRFDGTVKSLVVPKGRSSIAFFYRDEAAGTPTITVASRKRGWRRASQQNIIE